MGGRATERRGSGRGPAIDDARAIIDCFQERFDTVHVCVDELGVSGAKRISEGTKAGAVGVENYKQVGRGVEGDTM